MNEEDLELPSTEVFVALESLVKAVSENPKVNKSALYWELIAVLQKHIEVERKTTRESPRAGCAGDIDRSASVCYRG